MKKPANVNPKDKLSRKSQVVKKERITLDGEREEIVASSESTQVELGDVDPETEWSRARNIIGGTEPSMTSLEIAEITGMHHLGVMRGLRIGLKKVGIDESKFRQRYLDSSGRSLTCYNLPHAELLLGLPRYRVRHRHAIIKRMIEIEARHEERRFWANFAEALRARADELEKLAPKS